MRKINQKIEAKLNETSGMVSLLVTGLALIGVLLIGYLVDRNTQSYMMQEVQGIMDSAGTNTLLQVLSTNHLKEELFGFSETAISKTDNSEEYPIPDVIQNRMMNVYQTQLNDYVRTNDILLEVQVDRANTRFKFVKGTWGLGTTTKARPYLVLDSVVQLRLKHAQAFDYSSSFVNKEVANLDGGTFTVVHIGAPNNGEILIVVRSVSRAVFR